MQRTVIAELCNVSCRLTERGSLRNITGGHLLSPHVLKNPVSSRDATRRQVMLAEQCN